MTGIARSSRIIEIYLRNTSDISTLGIYFANKVRYYKLYNNTFYLDSFYILICYHIPATFSDNRNEKR